MLFIYVYVCILCINISPLFCLRYIEGPPHAQELPEYLSIYDLWFRVGLKVIKGWVRKRFMRQPVYHDWLLCCKILWNLPINSFSLHSAYKRWWKPRGAAVSELQHSQHLSLQLIQMVFWVTSQHCCNVEQGSPRLTDNDFQKQTKPRSWRNAFALKKKKKSTCTSTAMQWKRALNCASLDDSILPGPWTKVINDYLLPPAVSKTDSGHCRGPAMITPSTLHVLSRSGWSYNFVRTGELIPSGYYWQSLAPVVPGTVHLHCTKPTPTPYRSSKNPWAYNRHASIKQQQQKSVSQHSAQVRGRNLLPCLIVWLEVARPVVRPHTRDLLHMYTLTRRPEVHCNVVKGVWVCIQLFAWPRKGGRRKKRLWHKSQALPKEKALLGCSSLISTPK